MNTIVWQPKDPEKTRLWQFMRQIERNYDLTLPDYQTLHQWSITHPTQFWSALCAFFNIHFTTQATEVLNDYQHPLEARWFSGATFNFAEQLLRRQDHHPALISVNEQGDRKIVSYHELNQLVAACAEGLK